MASFRRCTFVPKFYQKVDGKRQIFKMIQGNPQAAVQEPRKYKHEIDTPPEEIKNPIAVETLDILRKGTYTNDDGVEINIKDMIDACNENTKLFKPEHVHVLPECPNRAGKIIVTKEKTLNTCQRLIIDEHKDGVVALNYASARNPGGGFWSLADEQEETLSRASSLWLSLIQNKEMYQYNRDRYTLLYSDYMILSPDVPVSRDITYKFLQAPYKVSIITSPAVNAGPIRRRHHPDEALIEETMINRIRKVVSVAACGGYKTLILGAWGCCCFRNDPIAMAEHFKQILVDEGLGKYFDEIIFPIHDYNKGRNLTKIFCDVLGVEQTEI